MADTLTKIATVTVGSGGATTVNFSSIPQTYTDLVLKISMRSTATGLYNGAARLTFNSSTASNYTLRRIYGTGTTAASNTQSLLAYARVSNNQASASNTSNTFGNSEVYIANYTSSSIKSFSEDSVSESNIVEAYPQMTAAIWNPSSNVPITSITLTSDTDSFTEYSTFTLYGIASTAAGAKATGGIITSDANYFYHTFKASGTFTPTQSLSCDMLVVAGGAGGSFDEAGGGGAGGLLALTSQSLSATGYSVTVGGGGRGGYGSTTTTRKAANGTDSSFAGLGTAIGGGSGAQWNVADASTGGSGGGGSVGAGSANAGAAGTTGQGYAGGDGSFISAANRASGGGGGAGGIGGNGILTGSGTGGSGGVGSSTYSSWLSVTNVGQNVSGTYYIAGGGGGFCGNTGGTAGPAGYGGGGLGACYTSPLIGANGTANTGGGAGAGAGTSASTQTGGSGVVIVRYAK